jgi:hypothetical protein
MSWRIATYFVLQRVERQHSCCIVIHRLLPLPKRRFAVRTRRLGTTLRKSNIATSVSWFFERRWKSTYEETYVTPSEWYRTNQAYSPVLSSTSTPPKPKQPNNNSGRADHGTV